MTEHNVSFDSASFDSASFDAAIGDLVGGLFEGHVAADLSHMLRPDPDSVGPRGYRRAARTPVSPEVLGIITAWVTRTWGEA